MAVTEALRGIPVTKVANGLPVTFVSASVGGGGSTFPVLSGTVLARYSAKAGVGLSGSNVTSWSDQSGNGKTLTGVANPTYSVTGFNTSYPGITTSGGSNSGSYLVTANRAIATGGVTAMTFWMVFKPIGEDLNDRYLSTVATAVNSNDFQGNGSAVPFIRLAGGIGAFANSSTTAFAVADGTNSRVAMVFNGVNITSYLNNVQQSQVANTNPTRWGTVGTDLLTLAVSTSLSSDASGNSIAGPAALTGYAAATFAEIVMMAGAASAGDRTAMDNYLKSEWGL
jgi:hypothetical protein